MRFEGEHPLADFESIDPRSYPRHDSDIAIADWPRVVRRPRDVAGATQVIPQVCTGGKCSRQGFDIDLGIAQVRGVKRTILDPQISSSVKESLFHKGSACQCVSLSVPQ